MGGSELRETPPHSGGVGIAVSSHSFFVTDLTISDISLTLVANRSPSAERAFPVLTAGSRFSRADSFVPDGQILIGLNIIYKSR